MIADDVAQIIDFKTGSQKWDSSVQEYGLNLQLPIYAYLFSHTPEFKNININGLYYLSLKISDNNSNPYGLVYFDHDLACQDYDYEKYMKIFDSIKLSGRTYYDEISAPLADAKSQDRLLKFEPELFNEDLSFNDKAYSSKYIHGLKFKKTETNEIHKNSRNSCFDNIDLITGYIEQIMHDMVEFIKASDFRISPYFSKKISSDFSKTEDDKYSCKYCRYKDVCFFDKTSQLFINQSDKKHIQMRTNSPLILVDKDE